MDLNSTDNQSYGQLKLNGLTINPQSEGDYSEEIEAALSGQSVNITLYSADNSTTEFSVNLYFPEPIPFDGVTVPDTLKAGSQIIWNADPNNQKGVLLVLEYNQDYMFSGGTERHIFIETDDGSYTISGDDINGMNTSLDGNNNCTVSIVRRDYVMAYHVRDPSINTRVYYSFASPWFPTIID